MNAKGEIALRLDRSLYGLKQAGRLWHQFLEEKLHELGFEQSLTDSCIFYKIHRKNAILLGVYVDDLLETILPVSGPGTPEHQTIKYFKSVVSSFLWVARCARPDIAYAVLGVLMRLP